MAEGQNKFRIVKYEIDHSCIGAMYWTKISCFSGVPGDEVEVGVIYFCPEGVALGNPIMMDNGHSFLLYYESKRYQEIIDTLRYEKPVYVTAIWDDYVIRVASISTHREPVGEQEGV